MIDRSIPLKLLRNPLHLLSLGFGSGLSKYAPGTMGTLAAIPLFLLMHQLDAAIYSLIVLTALVAGFYCTHKTGQVLGVADHGAIVWDEFVGYFITMAVLPLNVDNSTLDRYPLSLWILTGFILFRLFDIWKPWPIRLLEHKIPGGFGVMLDDVVAGIFAAICFQIILLSLNLT